MVHTELSYVVNNNRYVFHFCYIYLRLGFSVFTKIIALLDILTAWREVIFSSQLLSHFCSHMVSHLYFIDDCSRTALAHITYFFKWSGTGLVPLELHQKWTDGTENNSLASLKLSLRVPLALRKCVFIRLWILKFSSDSVKRMITLS